MDGYDRQFFTGGTRNLPHISGISLTWWVTRRGLKLLGELTRLVVAELPQLGLDRDSAEDTIEKVLEQNATNKDLFVGSAFLRHATLFESRAVEPGELASRLWTLIVRALENSVAEWLVVAPLPRVKTATYEFSVDGLTLLAAGDAAAWERASHGFSSVDRWDTVTGRADPRDADMIGHMPADSWLVCRARGTQRGANIVARERMRTCLAILLANYCAGDVQFLGKSMATVPTYGIQFPEQSSHTGVGYSYMHVGEMVPPFGRDLGIAPAHAAGVRDWYERLRTALPEQQKRAFVASQFAHYAVVAHGLEQFVHFFVTLDALFGVRGRVGESISDGFKRMFNADPLWAERATKLFDLRNELVHGGSSRIDGWAGYDSYERRFETDPAEDVAVAALTALKMYPV